LASADQSAARTDFEFPLSGTSIARISGLIFMILIRINLAKITVLKNLKTPAAETTNNFLSLNNHLKLPKVIS